MYVRDPESILTSLALKGDALLSEASLMGHFWACCAGTRLQPVSPNAVVGARARIDGEIPLLEQETPKATASPVL